jgi:hypothetical protein
MRDAGCKTDQQSGRHLDTLVTGEQDRSPVEALDSDRTACLVFWKLFASLASGTGQHVTRTHEAALLLAEAGSSSPKRSADLPIHVFML